MSHLQLGNPPAAASTVSPGPVCGSSAPQSQQVPLSPSRFPSVPAGSPQSLSTTTNSFPPPKDPSLCNCTQCSLDTIQRTNNKSFTSQRLSLILCSRHTFTAVPRKNISNPAALKRFCRTATLRIHLHHHRHQLIPFLTPSNWTRWCF